MARKITTFILTLIIISGLFTGKVFAVPPFDDSAYRKTETILLIDSRSGNVLFEKNADAKIFPASTTKILTSIIIIEQGGDLNQEFSVGTGVGGSSVRSATNEKLIQGEKIKLIDLLYGLMLPSGNDAAKTIALNMGGIGEDTDEETALNNFADIMNQTAQELGMEDSHFLSPSGLHNENHYTTAKDMAKAARYAMTIELFRTVVSTVNYIIPPTNKYNKDTKLTNSNRLILPQRNGADNPYYNEYAIGIKTGDTSQAGRCLVAAAKKENMELIVLIFGDRTDSGEDRWKIANKLFEWGFENFVPANITPLILDTKIPVQISNASINDSGFDTDTQKANLDLIPAYKEGDERYISVSSEISQVISSTIEQITSTPSIFPGLTAPIEQGKVCGSVEYSYNGEVIYTIDLVASRDVKEFVPDEPINSPSVTKMEPIEPPKPEPISLWWWMLIPVILILALFVRWIMIRKRKKNRFKKRRRYRYNIRK